MAMSRKLANLVASNRDRIVGGAEQGLASLISMGGLIVLSRLMPIDAFGIFAFAVGVWLVLEMLQHSAVISPFIVSCPAPLDAPEEFGAWMFWNLTVGIGSVVVLLLAGLIALPLQPWLGEGLLLSAPIAFSGMLYMFVRRIHYHLRERRALIAQTLLYGASYATALASFFVFSIGLTPLSAALILTLAYGVPAMLFSLRMLGKARFDRSGFLRIGKSRKLITQLAAAGAIWEASYSGALLALGIFGTPAAVAIYSITRTLVRPVSMVLSTLIDVDLSRASRRYAAEGRPGLAEVVSSVWLSAAALTMVPVALLIIFPGFFLELIYGTQYAGATTELQLRVLIFVPLICVAPLDIGLTVLRDTRFLMLAHLAGLAVGTACLTALGLMRGVDATSVLIALVAARLTSMPLLHLRYRRLMAGAVLPSATGTEVADVR